MLVRTNGLCVLAVLALIGLAAPAAGEDQPAPAAGPEPVCVTPIPGITPDNYPRVNGSTSTTPLGHLLALRALGYRGELRPSTTAQRLIGGPPVKVEPVGPPATSLYIRGELQLFHTKARHEGTHAAYVSLITGKSQMILVARKPSDDEIKEAAERNVELDIRPVALDGFVFLVNAKNPVDSLTMEQIRGIYTGKVTNWKELGGSDAPIEAYTRNRNSGSQELMEKLVMKGLKMIDAPDRMLMGMAGPIDMVSQSPNAIGYSVYYYEHVMHKRPENKLLGINGVKPSSETISARDYPLVTDVFVVARKHTDPNSPEALLRDWLLSEDGQKLVAQSGYVPFTPREETD